MVFFFRQIKDTYIMTLPTLLTPQLLEEILHYAANQRRKIETDLEVQFEHSWKPCRKSSSKDFYRQLHDFLQIPNHRNVFDQITRNHSNKRRSLTLPDAIHKHYQKKYPGILISKSAGKQEKWTPVDIVHQYATNNDFECLTNVVWAFAEWNLFDKEALIELSEQYPDLKAELEIFIEPSDTTAIQQNWSNSLEDLSIVISKLKQTSNSDVNLSNELLNVAQRMVEIASYEQKVFLEEVDTVLSKFSDFFDEHTNLAKLRNQLNNIHSNDIIIEKCRSELSIIERAILDFKDEEQQSKKLIGDLANAKFERQKEINIEITQRQERQSEKLNLIESALSRLLQHSSTTDHPLKTPPTEIEDEEKSDDKQTKEVNSLGQDNTTRISAPELVVEELPKHHEQPHDSNVNEIDATSSKQREFESHELNEPSLEQKSIDLLNRLFEEGRLSLAYWVAKESGVFDANIIGTLSEGSRVEPSSTCPAKLSEFINRLNTDMNRSDEENLLLVAAIIQPLIFLRTYPDSLYSVVSTIPFTPLTEIVEIYRKNYLSQGITLGPRSFVSGMEISAIEQDIARLSVNSREFIDHVPKIRIGFAPADRGIRFLYKKGTKLHKLHKSIERKEFKRIGEIKELIKAFNPQSEINSIPHSVLKIKQKLEGYANEQLARYLNNSIDLASKWVNLVELKNQERPEGDERLEDQLKQSMTDGIEKVLRSLDEMHNKSPAIMAASYRLKDLQSVLVKGVFETSNTDRIYDACINLPGVCLYDDLSPVATDLETLIEAVRKYSDGEYEPSVILEECLERDEYVRVSRLIKVHHLGKDVADRLIHNREERRNDLQKNLENLQSKVEEAFLLGQLWDEDQDVESRADLLSQVTDGFKLLNSQDSELSTNIRLAALIVKQIENRLNQIAATRNSFLESEKMAVEKRFPKTRRGAEDREYFIDALDQCLEQKDYVTAHDLLERAQRSVDQNEPIARTSSIELGEHFTGFLNFAEEHRDNLHSQKWKKQFIDAIERRKTFPGIAFGGLDAARRQDSIRVLEKWEILNEPSDVEEVCRFIGFPVVSGKTKKLKTNVNLPMNFQIELVPNSTKSPLPGFGSDLNSQLDVIVCQRSFEPEQITEFTKQFQTRDRKALLVLLTKPISMNYRLKWLKECVQSRVMMLPLDLLLLMYLCGQRNRLSVLLEVGLPFTWAQPYITKGENVAREMFVGRKSEVSDLSDPRGGCIVFGGRQLGKSALLTHVKREYHNPQESGGTYIAYLDINDLGEPQKPDEMNQTFWKRVFQQLENINAIKDEENVARRKKSSQLTDYVPNLIETTLSVDDNRRIVLLLDETDKFLDLDSKWDFKIIRGLRAMMAKSERRFKVVLAGLHNVQRFNKWKNHPFAQLGKEIVINPLQPKAAEVLITRPFRALGFKFEKSALVCRIVSISNYHPGLIQIFCYRLLENLYKNHSQSKSPVRTVNEDDVLTIEQDASFREEVRNRFDWTLDLDDRYKVITYGLVLSERPTDSKSVAEFKELGESWWPQVFGDSRQIDAQRMRAVLDEMVGLGVLLREHGENGRVTRQYRLRSPNLLRLLGPKNEIEEELWRIISTDQLSNPNPREFHDLIDKNAGFSPLTKEQEGHISDPGEKFSLTFVLGSPAMGLREVPRQVRHVMNSIEDSREIGWEETKLPATGGMISKSNLVTRLKQQLKPRKRKHQYAIIDFEKLVINDEELGDLLMKLVGELGKICTQKSRGKLILLLNSEWTWKWVSSGVRHELEEFSEVTVMELSRWSNGAISNALDRIGLRTGSKSAGQDIFRLTAGVHTLVSKILMNGSRTIRANSVADIVEHANTIKSLWLEEGRSKLLAELGIYCESDLGRTVEELLGLCEKTGDDEYIVTEDSFEIAVEAFSDKSPSRKYLVEQNTLLLSWLHSLGLISSFSKEDSPSREEEIRFKACPLTLELINLKL